MRDQNQALTALIRSMKKTLKIEHGVEISHAALRASYLKASGENPFAFAGKTPLSDLSGIRRDCSINLHLAGDGAGCLTRLSLDKNNRYLLPTHFRFGNAVLIAQSAEVPRVKKYGLPDYLQNAKEFYSTHFGLEVESGYRSQYEDLGDDSGDSCEIVVQLTKPEFCRLMSAFLGNSLALQECISQWVSHHYRKEFNDADVLQRAKWLAQFIAADPIANEVLVVFEYVYPDEDGGHVDGTVDLTTGTIILSQEVPEDIDSELVRRRIWVAEYDDEPELFQGHCFEVIARSRAVGLLGFSVEGEELARLQALRSKLTPR